MKLLYLWIVGLVLWNSPVFAANGKIVFSSTRDGNSEIYVMNEDGSGQTNLTQTPSVQEGVPSWRPDGGRIVYQRTDDIWTMKSDGSDQTRIQVGHIPMQPDYDPTGQKIAYSAFGGFDHDVFVMDANGNNKTRIVANQLGDYLPRYSPDGSKIAFSTFNLFGSSYRPDVYIVNADGSGQTRITTSGGNANADWSPDGSRMVFQSDRDGNSEIYVMNADGTNQTRLTQHTANDNGPMFSPNGTQIVFVSNRDGDNEIYVINANGSNASNPIKLTDNTVDDNSPSWVQLPPPGAPSLSINDVSINEGNSGTANLQFTVGLSAASTEAITVRYLTTDGTAKAPADYTAANSGLLTFAPGQTTQTINIEVKGDMLDEADETLNVLLYGATNAFVSDDTGIGTIVDDDSPPTISIADLSQNEGQSGTTNFTFTVTLSEVSGLPVTVSYETADGTATQPADYTSTTGSVIVSAGTTSATFNVPVVGNTTREPDETFLVNLSSPVNATIADGQGTATIVNDDFPTLSIAGTTVTEGNSGTVNAAFTVTLSEASPDSVTFNFATSNFSAVSTSDYTATSGSRTLQPGETTLTINVPVSGDTLYEANETFRVTLSSPVNATLGTSVATGTIENDDTAPTLSIADASEYEGNSGLKNLPFTVTLSAAAGVTVSFRFTTSDGTATQPDDYVARNTIITIPTGNTSVTVPVQMKGDTVKEPDETLNVTLSTPTNATIADGDAIGTIRTDDLPLLSIAGTSVNEADNGTVNAVFTVTLSESSTEQVSFDFETIAGTATSDTDYGATSGSRTFLPGETTKNITVAVKSDTIDEADETFFVKLSNATNAFIQPSLPRDPSSGHAYELVAAPLTWDSARSAAEARTYLGQSGHLATITSASEQTFIANLISGNEAWIGGSQPAGSPEPASGFTWVTGEAFTYTNWRSGEPNNAPSAFGNEDATTFSTNGLWNDVAKGATVSNYLVEYDTSPSGWNDPGQGMATIIDNDPAPQLSINDVQVFEGNSGTTNLVFTITATGVGERAFAVDISTGDATAVAGADYQSRNQTVVFAIGDTSKQVTVPVIGENVAEADETFVVNLSGATNATISDAQGIGTILDDDSPYAPLNVSLTPDTLVSTAGVTKELQTRHSDRNGHGNIEYAMIEIGSGSIVLRGYYHKVKNKLYLLNENNTGYIGGFEPGSNNVISNSRGSLNCQNTTVTVQGDTLTINWSFTPSEAMAGGVRPVRLLVRDLSLLTDGWDSFGTWHIVSRQQPPTNDSLSPVNTRSVFGVPQNLQSKHTDLNGHEDIEYAMIEIGSGSNILRGYYHKVKHKLYLLNENNSGYIGGFEPGSNNVITNSRGSLNCQNTTVSTNGFTLTVNWNFTPTSAMAGITHDVKLLTRDLTSLKDDWEKFGTWAITQTLQAPMNVSLNPVTTQSAAEAAQSLETQHSDPNGHSDIEFVMIEVGSGNNILRGYYHKVKNKLYLLNDAGTAYIGGIAPGSANVISNSRGSLNCQNTSVSTNGNTLTVNWNFTPTSVMAGVTHDVKLLTRDLSLLKDDWEKFGTWDITAVGGLSSVQSENTSSVELLDAIAEVSSSSIYLKFAAEVPAKFTVLVNGQDVTVQSVEREGREAWLLLPEGSLKTGDAVEVRWTDSSHNLVAQ